VACGGGHPIAIAIAIVGQRTVAFGLTRALSLSSPWKWNGTRAAFAPPTNAIHTDMTRTVRGISMFSLFRFKPSHWHAGDRLHSCFSRQEKLEERTEVPTAYRVSCM
jgi:hypothetical protein